MAAVEGISCQQSISMIPEESNKFTPIQHFIKLNILSKQKKLNDSKDYHTFCETELAKLSLNSNLALFLLFTFFSLINPQTP